MILVSLALAAPAPVDGRIRPPLPINPSTWVRFEDYPSDADGAVGTTHFELVIDVDGVVTGCRILVSSRSKALDERSCGTMLARGRFAPARDEAGRPIVSRFRRRIAWGYGGRLAPPSPPPVDLTVTVNKLPAKALPEVSLYQIESAGVPAQACMIETGSKSDKLDQLACELAAKATFGDSAITPDGQPVRTMRVRRLRFAVAK